MTDLDHDGVAAMLRVWLPSQRWFGGKNTDVDDVRVLRDTPLEAAEDVRVHHLLVAVEQSGSATVVQVPVSLRPLGLDRLEHVRIGQLGDDVVYDALHDKVATAALLAGFQAGSVGSLSFHAEAGTSIPYDESSIVLSGEQSNTSVVYGDAAILKVFRRVHEGLNPDIEVHDALTRAGSTHVAPLLGWVDGSWPAADGSRGDERRGSLAMLQRYLVTATDGWSLASASVRDLFAEADLHADEVGGDFAAEASRLGSATAEVHLLLAETLGTATMGPPELRNLAGAMHRRLDEAVAEVPDIAPFAAGLGSAYDAVAALQADVPVQRIHGDYHLGQVLRTSLGWKLLDFEGEPERPMPERRLLDSPLRDVAGMLRSFDYAARHQLVTDHAGDTQIAYRAAEWSQRNRRAFRTGYTEAAGRHAPEDDVLLRAYETDKAVYEAVYEARNRPRWLPVPLNALERLAEDRAAGPAQTAGPTPAVAHAPPTGSAPTESHGGRSA